MRALKTIVAAVVIVFALTTVAMAGVQHFTKQSGQAGGTQVQQAQPTYSVTLTAAQLKQLIGAQGSGATKADATLHRTQQHRSVRVRETTQSTTRNDDGTCTPNSHDYDHEYEHDVSGDGEHHSGDGEHHSGDAGEGCR